MTRDRVHPKWFKCFYGVIIDVGEYVTMRVNGDRLVDRGTKAPIAINERFVIGLETPGMYILRSDFPNVSRWRHAVEGLNKATWDEWKRTSSICSIRDAER
jgi:hypothetical protein